MIAALFYRGPAWNDAGGIVAQSGFAEHLQWVERYRDSEGGPIIETAPFHDPASPVTDDLFGLALLDVESTEAARAVVEEDSVVQAGVLTYRLYDWRSGALRRPRAPETIVWELMRGALTARVLGIVAELRVADALAEGPRAVDALAQESRASADMLQRCLRALASDGVFAEEEPGVFRNTPASELLRGDGWNDFAHLFGGVFHRAAGELAADGTPVFERAFGEDFWEWLAARPEERASFDRAMGDKDRKAEHLAGAVEWRHGEVVVDVGGGNGTLLRGLIRRRPGLRGIVYDLSETTRDETLFGGDLTFVAGSFFDNVPPGDTYVLSAILHDWDDARAADILCAIRASAPSGARVLIAETVIQPNNEPNGSKWLDLLMLALEGGRERDEAQWRALVEAAGLEPVTVEDGLIQARCR